MKNDSTYFIPPYVDSSFPIHTINDGALTNSEMQCEFVAVENEEGPNFFSTDLFANIVSAGALLITLIIFIIQTNRARKEQKRAVKENWYLTIILQPNMSKLDMFYKDEADHLVKLIKKLKGKQDKETREKAKAMKELRDLKNDFFNHFILMVQEYDVHIAQEAENILNELADNNSKWIDHYNSVDPFDSKRTVFENKAKLINALYKGISKDGNRNMNNTWKERLSSYRRRLSHKHQ